MSEYLPFNSKKVLTIEDCQTTSMYIVNVLESRGYIPMCADNIEVGFLLAQKVQPDIILLDRTMQQDTDGDVLLRRLKENPETTSIPVIMLTGDKQIDSVKKSYDLGAVDYIIKPVEEGRVLQAIERALRGKPAQNPLNKSDFA